MAFHEILHQQKFLLHSIADRVSTSFGDASELLRLWLYKNTLGRVDTQYCIYCI